MTPCGPRCSVRPATHGVGGGEGGGLGSLPKMGGAHSMSLLQLVPTLCGQRWAGSRASRSQTPFFDVFERVTDAQVIAGAFATVGRSCVALALRQTSIHSTQCFTTGNSDL